MHLLVSCCHGYRELNCTCCQVWQPQARFSSVESFLRVQMRQMDFTGFFRVELHSTDSLNKLTARRPKTRRRARRPSRQSGWQCCWCWRLAHVGRSVCGGGGRGEEHHAPTLSGQMDRSTTMRRSTPWTRRWGSTTPPSARGFMAQVPSECQVVRAVSRTQASMMASSWGE